MQSEVLAKLYRSLIVQSKDNELIQTLYQWDVLTAEPGGVDYIETLAGQPPALWAIPRDCDQSSVLFCIHGGGYITGSMYSHRKLYSHIAKAMGMCALIVDYRLLPEGIHPGPLNDVFNAYRWLLDQGIDPRRVVFTGDSAGGGLAITTQLRAREQGLPMAAATMPLSPWVDMQVVGESMQSNSAKDALFNKAWVKELAANFLGGADPTGPEVNPLFADLNGFGPMYIQVGDHELLLDDSRRLAHHAQDCGVEVLLDVFPGQQHTFQMMAGRASEADDAIHRLAAWGRAKLRAIPQ